MSNECMAFMQCDDEGEISLGKVLFSESQFLINFWVDRLVLLLHLHIENPLKKQTEHWMVMAPSDFRSKVADWCKIIAKRKNAFNSNSKPHLLKTEWLLSSHSRSTFAFSGNYSFLVSCFENLLAASFFLNSWVWKFWEKERKKFFSGAKLESELV